MPDDDLVLDHTIREVADILAGVLVRIALSQPTSPMVDLSETESVHVTRG